MNFIYMKYDLMPFLNVIMIEIGKNLIYYLFHDEDYKMFFSFSYSIIFYVINLFFTFENNYLSLWLFRNPLFYLIP